MSNSERLGRGKIQEPRTLAKNCLLQLWELDTCTDLSTALFIDIAGVEQCCKMAKQRQGKPDSHGYKS